MIYPSRVKTGWGRAGQGGAGLYLPHAREPAKTRVHPARASSRLCLPRLCVRFSLLPLPRLPGYGEQARPAPGLRLLPHAIASPPTPMRSPSYSLPLPRSSSTISLPTPACDCTFSNIGAWFALAPIQYIYLLFASFVMRVGFTTSPIFVFRVKVEVKSFRTRCENSSKLELSEGFIAASDTCVKFVEILCDLFVTTFSPDGQVFQVDFDSTGVDSSGTVVGISFKDGVVLVLPASNRNA